MAQLDSTVAPGKHFPGLHPCLCSSWPQKGRLCSRSAARGTLQLCTCLSFLSVDCFRQARILAVSMSSIIWAMLCKFHGSLVTGQCLQGRQVRGSHATQKILLGTNTEGAEADYLLVYEVHPPTPAPSPLLLFPPGAGAVLWHGILAKKEENHHCAWTVLVIGFDIMASAASLHPQRDLMVSDISTDLAAIELHGVRMWLFTSIICAPLRLLHQHDHKNKGTDSTISIASMTRRVEFLGLACSLTFKLSQALQPDFQSKPSTAATLTCHDIIARSKPALCAQPCPTPFRLPHLGN